MVQELDWTQWITTGEAAALTGYSASNFRKALARGLLQGHKRGRDWFLARADILSLRAHQTPPAARTDSVPD